MCPSQDKDIQSTALDSEKLAVCMRKDRQLLPFHPSTLRAGLGTGSQGVEHQSPSFPSFSLVPDSLQITLDSGSWRAFCKPCFSMCPTPQQTTYAGPTQLPTAATKAPWTALPLPHLLCSPFGSLCPSHNGLLTMPWAPGAQIKPSLSSITSHFPGFCLFSSFIILVLPETSHLQRPLTPLPPQPLSKGRIFLQC